MEEGSIRSEDQVLNKLFVVWLWSFFRRWLLLATLMSEFTWWHMMMMYSKCMQFAEADTWRHRWHGWRSQKSQRESTVHMKDDDSKVYDPILDFSPDINRCMHDWKQTTWRSIEGKTHGRVKMDMWVWVYDAPKMEENHGWEDGGSFWGEVLVTSKLEFGMSDLLLS
jgi:hypothetical protein